jgi:hypothetical protein
MTTEDALIQLIIKGDLLAIELLRDYYNENDQTYIAERVQDYLDDYKDNPKLAEYLIRYGLTRCFKCGSSDTTSKEDEASMWNDYDILCAHCGEYIRMYDSG